MMPPTLTASTNARPAASVTSVRLAVSLNHPASAPVSSRAQPAVITISQPKYRFQPDARALPMVCSGLALANAVASWRPRVIWVSARRGRTGPANCSVVGSRCPNRSSSPGPDRLTEGAAAPTLTDCPTRSTRCIGVTRRATEMDSAATSTAPAVQASRT